MADRHPNAGRGKVTSTKRVRVHTRAEDQWLNVTYYEPADGKWVEQRPAPEGFRADKPFPTKAVATQSAKEAYDLVLARAGARVRDADDLRIIEEVKARAASLQTQASRSASVLAGSLGARLSLQM